MGLVKYAKQPVSCDTGNSSQRDRQLEVLPSYQIVNGLRICGGFIRENVCEAMSYIPSDDDLFIATYPKCGTTWTQQIVYLLLNDGRPPSGVGEYYFKNPFIDMLGEEGIRSMIRPAAIKTHLPFQYVPYNPCAKYICVVRNPKDALVSFYHHTKGIPGYKFANGSFDTYFELFLDGKVDYGDYFDHLISWWDHRHDANVIFLTFEEMKADIRRAVWKIAEFIDDSLVNKLKQDPHFMDNIVKYSSFDYMKEQDKLVRKPYEMPEQMLNNPSVPLIVKQALLNQVSQRETSESTVTLINGSNQQDYAHIRKGIVNDWKNHMTEDQNVRLVRKFDEKTAGTGIDSLWLTKDWL